MKLRTLLAPGVIAACVVSFAACSIRVGGGAKVSADGTVAILNGTDSVLIRAEQPPAPVPPPPPVKPRRILKAKVVGEKIEITGKVMFDAEKATIKEESHGLLNDVSALLSAHADIQQVRIEGHTDADGDDVSNRELSKQRAAAVKAFLLEKGIDDARLVAVGYGEERPRATNDTAAGREQNRRVEFSILTRNGKGETLATTGAAGVSGEKGKASETANYKEQKPTKNK